MKHLLLTLPILVFALCSQGQNLRTKKYEKDSGYVEIVYFPSGKISTIKLTPKQMYSRIDGYARAYNLQGKQIYHKTISTVGGHGSTTFAYYPNGVIQSVRSTFQPDGGIQHYDATRYYDDKGNFTHEEDNSWDRQVTYLKEPFREPVAPTQPTAPKPAPVAEPKPEPKQDVMECAGIAHMKAFVENMAEVSVSVKMIPHNPKEKALTLTVKPGERLYFGEYIMAGQFVDPTTYYRFELLGPTAGQVKFSNWTFRKVGEGRAYYIMAVLPR